MTDLSKRLKTPHQIYRILSHREAMSSALDGAAQRREESLSLRTAVTGSQSWAAARSAQLSPHVRPPPGTPAFLQQTHVLTLPVPDTQRCHRSLRVISALTGASDVQTIYERFNVSLTSAATTIKTRSNSDSGERALTCGDIPIRAQLVTTHRTLMVSKAN